MKLVGKRIWNQRGERREDYGRGGMIYFPCGQQYTKSSPDKAPRTNDVLNNKSYIVRGNRKYLKPTKTEMNIQEPGL